MLFFAVIKSLLLCLFANIEASIEGTTSASFASGQGDPLKSVKGFARAPKRRGHHDEEMTEMEVSRICLCEPACKITLTDKQLSRC